jgi:hypothetical protein
VAIGLAVAGVAWLVVWVTGSPPQKSAAAGGPQSVLFITQAGIFGSASPDGAGSKELTHLGAHAISGIANANPSVDGRYVVAADGSVISVGGGRIAAVSSRLDMATLPNDQLAYINPFTGGDGDVVLLAGGGPGYATADARVSLVDWRTGGQVANLGTADEDAGAAGDPAAAGAFVSVAASPAAGEGDARVELRDVGRKPVVLATAASLDRLLGQPSSAYYVLSPYPDPAGDRIAITVNSTQPGGLQRSVGVVVVTRSGRVLESLGSSASPQNGYGVNWSPDGTALLYLSQGPAGQQLEVWSPGSGVPHARTLPVLGNTADYCIWSPDGSRILCADTDLQTRSVGWLSGPLRGGSLVAGPGPGYPIEFLVTSR